MSESMDQTLRIWLDARDPGAAPAALRTSAAEVPYTTPPSRFPGLDAALTRNVIGSVSVRHLAYLFLALLAVVVVVGALVLRPWQTFPPRGLIAYTVGVPPTGSTGIRLVAVDGTGNRPVGATRDQTIDHSPRWSPDGRTLLFARNSIPNPNLIWCPSMGTIVLYDVATSTEQEIAAGPGGIGMVDWSPSGNRIAFTLPGPDCPGPNPSTLGVVDIASGEVTTSRLDDGDCKAAPESQTCQEGLLAELRLEWTAESVTVVEAVAPTPSSLGEYPSNDGRFLAIVKRGQRNNGTSQIEIVDTRTDVTVELGMGGAPAWSPDGEWLLFVRIVDRPTTVQVAPAKQLVIADVRSWQVRRVVGVTGGSDPLAFDMRLNCPTFWTPDSRAIYWVDAAGGHVMEVATGQMVDLPFDALNCFDIRWQPVP